MKKFLLSFGVVIVFLAYALHQSEETSQIHVTPPAPTAGQPSVQQQATPTTSVASPQPTTMPTRQMMQGSMMHGQYKDGTYTGSVADAFYGNIQVQAVISGGKITDVIFLQSPNDRSTSIEINSQAMPYLKQEAIAAQNANVDIVSGATDSSNAFRQSLGDALNQAKI